MMKKYVLSFLLLGVTMSMAAENKFGIKLSPSIAPMRLYAQNRHEGFEAGSGGFKLGLGLTYDIAFSEHYFLSTGLRWSGRKASIKNHRVDPKVDETYALDYLQLPLLMKLYTSELWLDTCMYFDFGILPEIKLSQRLQDHKALFAKEFKSGNLTGLIGFGFEYKFSPSNSVFAGLSYQHGLVNILDKIDQEKYDDTKVTCYTDLWSLDLGIKF